MSMFRKKEDSSTANYGGVDDSGSRRKSGITAGRIINSSIAIDFGCILVAGLIVIGLLANLHNQLKEYSGGLWPNQTHFCVLFGTCDGGNKTSPCTFHYSRTYGCEFIIFSSVINAGVALVFIVISIVRVIMAFDIWVTVIPEVVVLSVCVVLSFVVGVTISIGLDVTCDNLRQRNHTQTSCDQEIPSKSHGIKFYSWMNSAQAAAWFVFTFLTIALVFFIIRLVIFCRRRQKTREDREILTAEDRPPEDDDNKPI